MDLKLNFDVLKFSKDFGAFQNRLYEQKIASKFIADRACGVAAAANMLYYLSRSESYVPLCKKQLCTSEDITGFMGEILSFVKPTVFGIFTLEMMATRVLKYASIKNVKLSSAILANSKDEVETLQFIEYYLGHNIPVLMLNWNSHIKNLKNHWVTIVSLKKNGDDIVIGTSNWGRYEEFDFRSFVASEPLYKGLVAFM